MIASMSNCSSMPSPVLPIAWPCGACIVQCPSDALRFRRPDGRVVEPETIRTTRLNLLGSRSIDVSY